MIRCDHGHNTLHNHVHNLTLRNILCHPAKTRSRMSRKMVKCKHVTIHRGP